ncbi:MAG: PAS domain S-box-containing protein [Lentisphaeria bacterium]|jgi:PAS domain S-box-containing protein
MNEQRFFSYSATAQLVIDPIGDSIVAANQEACRLIAMSAEQIQARKVSQLFCASFPNLIVFTQELINNSRGWCDHMLLTTAKGELRVEINGRFITAGDENHLHLSVQRVDELDQYREQSDAHRHYLSGIGHWNRVSRIFQEFERENQLLLDAAGEGIYGVDAKGMTTFVNPAAQHILGYSAEELAGKNMHSQVHHSHADGAHFSVDDCPIFAAFKEGEVKMVEDDIFWSKSGQAIDVEYTSTPIRDSGFIVGAVVVFRDISQKKANAQKLLAALEEVESLKNRLEMEKAYLQEEISSEFNHHHIIGRSPALKNLIQQVDLVAPTDATVLISGESGTGKELIARAIHETSMRSHRPLIRVNCAAIPGDLFESEFFGHIKGAFTGATSDRPGRFELADGGTLFLDEVGEIPLHLQSKLLRVLQEQHFERIGDSITRKVDVRMIAATNRNLKEQVNEGRFREDLYFRLNVFPLESIPLRKRQEDIPLLTQHFLKKAGQRASKQGLKISIAELEKLKAYHWPGNIRELENVVERQVILAKGDTVRFDGLTNESTGSTVAHSTSAEQKIQTYSEAKQQDRRNILMALEKTQGKVFGRDGAAALLEIKPTTLASRIKKYKIDTKIFCVEA